MKPLKRQINNTLNKRLQKTFIQLISDFKNPKEIALFLEDFLTPTEFETLTKRIAIAYWLKKKRTNSNIKNNLKVNDKTIKRVFSLMKREGIKLALKKIEAEEFAVRWSNKIEKFIK